MKLRPKYGPGDNSLVLENLAKQLEINGYRMFNNLGGNIVGLAKDVGQYFANTWLRKRKSVIGGGETTVKLCKKPGVGGRNQEMVLSFLVYCAKTKNLFDSIFCIKKVIE